MEKRKRSQLGYLFLSVLMVLTAASRGPAQDAQQGQSPQAVPAAPEDLTPKAMLDTTGKTKLSLFGEIGFGFSKIDVGVTSGGDTVSISGGGGFGFGAAFGYGLSRTLDLDIDLGAQASVLTPSVKNATGTFSRGFLLATLKYKVPTSDSGQFKFGFGIGEYFGGKLDVDTTDVLFGNHTIVKYEPAPGFHVTGEFERFIRPTTSFHLGAKIYFVKYKADSATVDALSVPVAGLPDDVRNFDGSGMDFMIGISQYFN